MVSSAWQRALRGGEHLTAVAERCVCVCLCVCARVRAVIEFFNRYLAQVQSGTSKASRSSSKGSEPLLPTHHVINSDSSGTLDTNVSSSSGAGSTEQYSTPDQVLAVLTHAVTHWRPETVKTFTQLRYARTVEACAQATRLAGLQTAHMGERCL